MTVITIGNSHQIPCVTAALAGGGVTLFVGSEKF